VHLRLTYANVVATLALFVALGGSSYAAIQLGADSVTSRNIAKGQVKASDIGKSAVTSAKVKDASLLATDFQAGQLPAGPAGPTGQPGARGPEGPRGERGPEGAPGLSGLEKVVGISATDSASPKVATAKCPTGKVAISVGYDIEGGKEPAVSPNGLANVIADVVESSGPGSEGFGIVEAWEEEPTALTWAIHATAICAPASS
jgi:hypothetical protein